ncbi:MAG: putative bifunctional diguanylate cyclase/phosphodiesterase [Stenotrophobium sp.]
MVKESVTASKAASKNAVLPPLGEDRLGLVIEAAPNAMVMVDAAGLIALVNSQAEKLFGYSRTELLGNTIEMLVPKKFRNDHDSLRTGFSRHPETRSMGAGRDLFGLRKDGSEVPIEIGLNPLHMGKDLFVLASIIDITARKRMEELSRTAEVEKLRKNILDNLPYSMIATDLDGRVLTVNPAAERLLGYSAREMLNKNVLELIHDPHEVAHRASELSMELGQKVPADYRVLTVKPGMGLSEEREWTYIRKDRTTVPVKLSVSRLTDHAGEITGYLKVAYDITESKRAEAYIRHMAHHDGLTGLPNRTLLLDRLDMAIRQARRNNRHVGVLMMDLDHFKRVNDSLGHQVGDQLLIAVAHRISECLREVDTVARLGGDEFVVLATDVRDRDELDILIRKIVERISAPILINHQELLVTPSIGGSIFPEDGTDVHALIKNADMAMYYVKGHGRSSMQWFLPTMLEATEEKLALTTALRFALERNEFELHYQPEVALGNGRVIGMEALIRWKHPRYGDIMPDRFIALAEETGLILPIGEWVLETACEQCVVLQKKIGRPLVMAVNVSPRQFQQKDWLDVIERVLRKSGLQPSCLALEITEGLLMRSPEESAGMLAQIRNLGVSIVIDDFGTGYSSLSYITRFPIDKIKIDRSFVRDLATDAADAAIIIAVIAMARSLQIGVVAEGVETEEQLNYLRSRDCDEVQGFYYSKAVPAKDLPAVIERLDRRKPASAHGA